jgi:ATP-dependent DNA helicase RecG
MDDSELIFADELKSEATMTDFDEDFFRRRYKKYYNEEFQKLGIPLEQLLDNLKIAKNDRLTLAGLLLFGNNPERLRPQFGIKATYFAGDDVTFRDFVDKEEIDGKLIEQFKDGKAFIKRSLRRTQTSRNFNAPGVLEIPEEAFAEALANAIVHRNYYIRAPIQIYLFDNRVEIHSPGNLPNTITEENIKFGVHVERNPTILSLSRKRQRIQLHRPRQRHSARDQIMRQSRNQSRVHR